MVTFPLEVIVNILCRLPVKPLKRFRCVAKSWLSLIDNEKFAKLHYKRSLETSLLRHVIVRSGNDLFDVDLDNADPVKAKVSVIKPPSYNSVTGLLNSCNGLFLVSGEPIIMWNPFTKECKSLPRVVDDDFPVPFGCYAKVKCGFVLDSRNDDYKVVRVVQHMDRVNHKWIASRAHIYGLKSNSWSETVEFTYPIYDWFTDVNGALHTIVHTTIHKPCPVKIMAFSVECERHYEVKMPHLVNFWEKKGVCMSIHKLGGCLSMSCTNSSGIAVWVMKDYGVKGSWTKMWSFPMKVSRDELTEKIMKPLTYSKDGRKLLLCFGVKTFVWQDMRNQSVSVKGLPQKINLAEACVESLVSLHSKQTNKQVHDQDKEKDKKKRDGFLSARFKLVL